MNEGAMECGRVTCAAPMPISMHFNMGLVLTLLETVLQFKNISYKPNKLIINKLSLAISKYFLYTLTYLVLGQCFSTCGSRLPGGSRDHRRGGREGSRDFLRKNNKI